MARNLVISIAQMPVVGNDPEQNLETAARAVGEAARRGSDLVVLPELWTTGVALREATEQNTPARFDAAGAMRDLARSNGVAVAGSALMGDEDHFHNVLLLVTADGKLAAGYQKLHLFTPMDEHRYVKGGDEVVVCAAPWGQTGLSVCYDLRFPELFRRIAGAGAAAHHPARRVATPAPGTLEGAVARPRHREPVLFRRRQTPPGRRVAIPFAAIRQ